jgi:hypothetical protein
MWNEGGGGHGAQLLERADGGVEVLGLEAGPLGNSLVTLSGQVRGGIDLEQQALNRRRRRALTRAGLRDRGPSKRFRGCGRTIISTDAMVEVKVGEGVGHYCGLMTCGLVWVCPVCSAKIRHERSREVERGLTAALDLGYGIEFLTLTLRHHLGHRLGDLFGLAQKAWAAMRVDTSFRALMARFGLRFITVREVTYGPVNGWHPHFHLAVVTWGVLTDAERAEVEEGFWRAWSHQLERVGLDAERGPGVLLKPCTSTDGLASYLCKVGGDDGLMKPAAMELVRADLKRGKGGHRNPEEIAEDFVDTGDLADLALLQEYWRATKGRQMMTWSNGLKAELLADEVERTDEELAALERGGEVLMKIGRTAWARILQLELAVHVLEVAEQGGREGLVALMRLVAPDDWWYTVQPAEAALSEGGGL